MFSNSLVQQFHNRLEIRGPIAMVASRFFVVAAVGVCWRAGAAAG
jgi:hypothetical protein